MNVSKYNCNQCHSYCCSYPIIEIKSKDTKRLAAHLELSIAQVKAKYLVVEEYEGKDILILKHTTDRSINATSCVFLDKRTRKCKIYDGRPQICRDHPGDDVRCEWFDRMTIENGAGKKRKIIRLKQMPSTIDGEREEYDEDSLGDLLDSYTNGNGDWPYQK